MKQRALIAVALSCEPSFIILDEPTTALDVTIEAQILDMLADLRKRHHLSLMFIRHNLAVIRQVCDKVCVLYAGELVEWGNVDEVFDEPSHPYTKGLLASLPRLSPEAEKERLTSIPGGVPSLIHVPQGCIFASRCPYAEPACQAQEQSLRDVSPERLSRCWKAEQLWHQPWPRAEADKGVGGARWTGDTLAEVEDLRKVYRIGSFWDRLKLKRTESGRLSFAEPRQIVAVDRVSLEIRKGEVLGLVGESGCGKTTFGRCLVRLIESSNGRVEFDGMDVLGAKRDGLRPFRRNAQVIFQNPDSSLNPRMTIENIISRPLRLFDIVEPHEEPRRVAELLELVRTPLSTHSLDRQVLSQPVLDGLHHAYLRTA